MCISRSLASSCCHISGTTNSNDSRSRRRLLTNLRYQSRQTVLTLHAPSPSNDSLQLPLCRYQPAAALRCLTNVQNCAPALHNLSGSASWGKWDEQQPNFSSLLSLPPAFNYRNISGAFTRNAAPRLRFFLLLPHGTPHTQTSARTNTSLASSSACTHDKPLPDRADGHSQ